MAIEYRLDGSILLSSDTESGATEEIAATVPAPERDALIAAFFAVHGYIPETVTPRQMKLALLQAGMLDQVETFVSQGSREGQISWEYAIEYRRGDALLNQMATSFGLTENQIDNLFRTAVTL